MKIENIYYHLINSDQKSNCLLNFKLYIKYPITMSAKALTLAELNKALDTLKVALVKEFASQFDLSSIRIDELHQMLTKVLTKQDVIDQSVGAESKKPPPKKGGRKPAAKKLATKKPAKKGSKKDAESEEVEEVEVDEEVEEVEVDEDVEVDEVVEEFKQDTENNAEIEETEEASEEPEEDSKSKKATKKPPAKAKTSPKKVVKKEEVEEDTEVESKSKKTTKKSAKPAKKEKDINKSDFFELVYDNDLDAFDHILTDKVKAKIEKDNKAKLKDLDDDEKKEALKPLLYHYLKDNHDKELIAAKNDYLEKKAQENMEYAETEDLES